MATFSCVFIFLFLHSGFVIYAQTPQATQGTTVDMATAFVTTLIDDDIGTTKLPDEVTFLTTRTLENTKLPDNVSVGTTKMHKTTKLTDNVTVRTTSGKDNGATTRMSKTEIANEAISLVRAKSSALVISWKHDLDAEEYYIRYYPKYDQQNLHVKHVPAPINEAKLSELDADTVYVIQIEARTSLSYLSMGTVEMETLKAGCSSSVETALIYALCLFAVIIILLLIILCYIGRLKRKPIDRVEESRNGDVKLRNKGLEHHNPGYQPTEEDADKRTSHAYIYITPENTPVSSPMFILPDTKSDTKQ